jgi:hypothetical protein
MLQEQLKVAILESSLEGLKPFVSIGRGKGSYKQRYMGQTVAITTKGYIWISHEVRRLLGNCEYVQVLQNKSVWALKPANKDTEGAYFFDEKSKGAKNVIRCIAFIRDANLPIGYIFQGDPYDGMLVFSKTPVSKA